MQGPQGPAQGEASPSPSLNPNPLADLAKTVGSANPSFSLLPHMLAFIIYIQ
jgi:hypothetical protein